MVSYRDAVKRPYNARDDLSHIVAGPEWFYAAPANGLALSGPFATWEEAADACEVADAIFDKCPIYQIGVAAQAAMSVYNKSSGCSAVW